MKLVPILSSALLLCTLTGCVLTPDYRYSGGADGYYSGTEAYGGSNTVIYGGLGSGYYADPWSYRGGYYGSGYYGAPGLNTRVIYSRSHRSHTRHHRYRHMHHRGHGRHDRGHRNHSQHRKHGSSRVRRTPASKSVPPVRSMRSHGRRSGSGLAPPPRRVYLPDASRSGKSKRSRRPYKR